MLPAAAQAKVNLSSSLTRHFGRGKLRAGSTAGTGAEYATFDVLSWRLKQR